MSLINSKYDDDMKARQAAELVQEQENHVLAMTVAILLGGFINPLKSEDNRWHNRFPVCFDSGAQLDLCFEEYRNKGKLRVHGYNCKDKTQRSYGNSAPDVNISTSKTPQQICNDIRRRFLPEYLKCWEESCKLKAQQEERDTRLDSYIQRVLEVPGTRALKHTKAISVNAKGVYGDVKYISSTNGEATLELRNVPFELLIQMLSMLA